MMDQDIVRRMREMAQSGCDVIAVVAFLRSNSEFCEAGSLLILRYFMEAFQLSLSEVRPLEGAECLGNEAYADSEINLILLPLRQQGYRKVVLEQSVVPTRPPTEAPNHRAAH